MAVLAVIGGIDSRPRLGGLVQLKEWGLGTVSRIAPNGKVTVQCGGQQKAKICSISQVKPVSSGKESCMYVYLIGLYPLGVFRVNGKRY